MFDVLWNFFTGPFPAFIEFLASAITLALGLIALWTLFRHRGELSVFLRVITNSHLNERFRRIRETLSKIETLSYDNKEDRQEIKALLGKISGHIRALPNGGPGITHLNEQIAAYLAKPATLSEARKRALVHELDGLLDNVSSTATTNLIKLHE